MPPQNSKHYHVPFGNDANFVNHLDVADIKMQPKFPKFLLDMRYFCNFSLVSLGTRPRSRRCAERTRKGEGRWIRPPKAALERSYIRPRYPVPRIEYFGRDKKTPDQIPDTKEGFYIYLYWVYACNSKCTVLNLSVCQAKDVATRCGSGAITFSVRRVSSPLLYWE